MEKPNDFYMMGSMGHAVSIGIGVALETNRQVYVIGGDGEFLMKMGNSALIERMRLENLHYIILNNNAYESTGGQPSDFKHIKHLAESLYNVEVIDVRFKNHGISTAPNERWTWESP